MLISTEKPENTSGSKSETIIEGTKSKSKNEELKMSSNFSPNSKIAVQNPEIEFTKLF
jgi:hypothetical protein